VSEPDELGIEACLAGDQRCWAALVKRFEKSVARQMWRFSRDPAVCEELMQDVFVELYYSLPRYRRHGVPFEHWLRCIATRVGYRHWKRQKRERGTELLDRWHSAAAGPDQTLEASDAASLLHTLLAQLPAADRLVLSLMYFEECDTQEIARRTGWNRAMVKMRLVRARRKLKKIVDASSLCDHFGSAEHGSPGLDRLAGPKSPA
jgi:RNA polymerase sigma-70 factor (ECF subfamily)